MGIVLSEMVHRKMPDDEYIKQPSISPARIPGPIPYLTRTFAFPDEWN